MSARRYLKGGLLLSGGSILSAACSFARNIIIARLISVEDFGIAATFAMTMSLIEMASNLALDRLLVQAPDGNAPRMLATAHAFQVVRGVLAAIVLFLLAGPVATLFKIPDVVWAFQIIALVPLIRSFLHLDAACQQRDMRFSASVWLDTVPQVLTALAAAPLALWLGDYRVMLWVVLGQVVLMTLVSHLVAERPYRWAWDRAIIGRMLRFGWPLLINGLLMFAIFQGDKAIIGAAFTMEELGWFAAAFGLTLMPAILVPKVLGTLLFPTLSRAHTRGDVDRQAIFTLDVFAYAAMLMAVLFWIFGPELLMLVFGQKYEPAAEIVVLLGISQAVRVLKAGHITVAFAAAKTRIVLWVNMARAASLALSIVLVVAGFGLTAVVVSGLIGEIVSLLIASCSLSRFGICFIRAIRPTAVAATSALVVAVLHRNMPQDINFALEVILETALLIACVLCLFFFKFMRQELQAAMPRQRGIRKICFRCGLWCNSAGQ